MGRIIDKILERRKLFLSRQPSAASSVDSPPQHDDDGASGPLVINSTVPAGWFYSFEFFPPKTEAGLDNLLTRIDRMIVRLDPLYINVTWGAAGQTAARSMAVATHAQKYLGVDVLLHVTCQGMPRDDILRVLHQAKTSGIRNLLALRGDAPRGQRAWKPGDVSGGACERAIDLVRLIRETYGDYFCIAVAGHPEGHPSSTSQEEEINHLKQKLECGADFVVTQFFYDTDVFLDFVKRCRAQGIDCPIIPGILPIQSFNNFARMTEYCNTAVPKEIWARLEPVKEDMEAVKQIGCELAVEMCRRIINEADGVDGVHFYTLNLERSVAQILGDLGAVDLFRPENQAQDPCSSGNRTSLPLRETIRTNACRQLPWRPSAMTDRSKQEQVRPINWANRPKSYVRRTEEWDEFPNGRWGDATSPAFGELSEVGHFYQFSLGNEDDQRALLGHCPTETTDVYEVFAQYVEGKLPHIPWCESPLQPESFLIQRQLAKLNRKGFLTVNSQPSVNGISSTHNSFGWGGPNGFIYQKAYCECFCSPENTRLLVAMVKSNPSMNLYAVNNLGNTIQEGIELGGVTALTWGVFPNREILQPTIFDPSTFLVWAEEAFSLWTTMWANLYDFDSDSFDLIETIRDTFYLCAIIHNNYIGKGTEGSTLWQAMEECG
jgi:methylenetetrahydrofolate reductase (NADPH)